MDNKFQFKIKIKDIDDARTLVNFAGKFDCDIDLLCEHYVVDCKSILGIFSLDHRKDIVVQFHGKVSKMMQFQKLLEDEGIQVNACL